MICLRDTRMRSPLIIFTEHIDINLKYTEHSRTSLDNEEENCGRERFPTQASNLSGIRATFA